MEETTDVSVKPPRRRRGRGVFGLNTPRQGGGGRGVFKPNTPMPSQGKVVLQFILRPPGSIWRAGDGIWKLKGVFEEKNKFLTISILNLRIICEYLKLDGIKRENQKLKPWYFPSWNENLTFSNLALTNLLDSIPHKKIVLVTQSLLIHSFMSFFLQTNAWSNLNTPWRVTNSQERTQSFAKLSPCPSSCYELLHQNDQTLQQPWILYRSAPQAMHPWIQTIGRRVL